MDGAVGRHGPRRPRAGAGALAATFGAFALLLAVSLLAPGCSDDQAASPTLRRATLLNVTAPDSLTARDTLVVEGLWAGGGCDFFAYWSLESKGDVLTLTPWIGRTGEVCPAVVFMAKAAYRLWPAPPAPFTLRVVGAADTVEVRVVARGPAAVDGGASHAVTVQEQGTGRLLEGVRVALYENDDPASFAGTVLDSGLTDASGTFCSFVRCAAPGFGKEARVRLPGQLVPSPTAVAELPPWTCGRSTRTTVLVPTTVLFRGRP